MPAVSESRYLVTCTWADVPHLDEKTKRELEASIEPHLRDARMSGIPSMGAGAIYPIPLSELLVDPFEIPPYWPRAYALDVGWKKTAAVWGAWDRSVDVLYLYTEHYRGMAEPSIHATAIKARGEWIRGVADPASRGRSQADGHQLFATYQGLGLHLTMADNTVNGPEGGIYRTYELMSTGRLKVFRTMQNWQAEYRLYRRDENGKVVKEFDHLMDCMRYLVMSGKAVAQPVPVKGAFVVGPSVGDVVAGY